MKLLAVAWDLTPVEAVVRLLEERLDWYHGKHNLAWITGAVDN